MKCKLCDKEFEKRIHNKMYCSVKCSQIAYNLRHPKRRSEISKRWRKNNPEKYLDIIHKYRSTKNGKITTRKAAKKWVRTIRGRKIRKEYSKSETYMRNRKRWLKTVNGKEYSNRKETRRRRRLNFIPITQNPFPDDIPVVWHHINDTFVFPVPEVSHENYNLGEKDNIKHREECNRLINNLGFELGEFLAQ